MERPDTEDSNSGAREEFHRLEDTLEEYLDDITEHEAKGLDTLSVDELQTTIDSLEQLLADLSNLAQRLEGLLNENSSESFRKLVEDEIREVDRTIDRVQLRRHESKEMAARKEEETGN